ESVAREQRHALVLQAWESINSEREMEGVLSALANVLVPVVPFFAVAVIAPEARQGAPWAMHVVGMPLREGESVDNITEQVAHEWLRATDPAHQPMPEKKLIPYKGSELEEIKRSDSPHNNPYICDDLLEKDAWFPHEFKLAAVGIRAYT